ncbi:MAG: BlaI/MecI/CopY family transcriptional regulator [Lachnospiraceae bacterium]|nr:BlaI/MecI/CopY family transcriptional regulator [Lachnospiraceae bacterium]
MNQEEKAELMEKKPLSKSEVFVMKCIWDLGRALTPNEIRIRLQEVYQKRYAYPTINTYLKNIMMKGYVSQNRDNYSFRYEALVTEEEYRTHEINEMKKLWTGGSAKKMAALVLEPECLSEDEKQLLRRLLNE